jgi:hypothetical protein
MEGNDHFLSHYVSTYLKDLTKTPKSVNEEGLPLGASSAMSGV